MDRARGWADRCAHEAQLHSQNCFITLTYNAETIPQDFSLRYTDFQKFIRRLRKTKGRLSFFVSGEYGGKTLRPHFHALLFGIDFSDKTFHRRGEYGDHCYRSALLEKLWPLGHSELGEVSPRSTAYVTGYLIKKNLDTRPASVRYQRVDSETGEVWNVKPEFHRMSLNPAIGKNFAIKYRAELLAHAAIVHAGGSRTKLPRFYRDLLASDFNSSASLDAASHSSALALSPLDQSPERLRVRESVSLARLKLKKRNLE